MIKKGLPESKWVVFGLELATSDEFILLAACALEAASITAWFQGLRTKLERWLPFVFCSRRLPLILDLKIKEMIVNNLFNDGIIEKFTGYLFEISQIPYKSDLTFKIINVKHVLIFFSIHWNLSRFNLKHSYYFWHAYFIFISFPLLNHFSLQFFWVFSDFFACRRSKRLHL